MLSKHLNKTQNAVFGLVLFCTFILLLRVQITQDIRYIFLLWNLFLALIPYMISELLINLKISKLKIIILSSIWLLFLPNAPYIITDFIHFHNLKSALVWYDLFTFFCFSISGFLLGVFSMLNMYQIIKKHWSIKLANWYFPIVCLLSGFGIYLGRFLRFNSWDIITKPIKIISKSFECFNNSECWYMTIGFGFLQWLIFVNLKMWNSETQK